MKTQQPLSMTRWRRYFESNKTARDHWNDVRSLHLSCNERDAIVRSLQRFQVGESGEGKHLRRCAASLRNEDYSEAIALFIAEEGEHARLLSRALEMLGTPLLHGHWSDALFIAIRRLGGNARRGLRLELMILLVAEMIAKRYYRALYEGVRDENLRRMCAQILRDEVGHVAFHCDYLNADFASLPKSSRVLARGVWRAFFRIVCLVVALDHRGALRECGVSTRDWWRECNAIFDCTVTRIFAPHEQTLRAPSTTSLLHVGNALTRRDAAQPAKTQRAR